MPNCRMVPIVVLVLIREELAKYEIVQNCELSPGPGLLVTMFIFTPATRR